MVRQPNPYHPGFNQPPAVLAGRGQLLADVGEALEVAAFDHRTPRPIILIGPRGVGKTVTLGEVANMAGRTLSWPTVHVEAKPGAFLDELAARLTEVTQLLAGTVPARSRRRTRLAGGKISAQAFGVGLGGEVVMDPVPSSPAPRAEQVQALLRGAAETAIDRNAGIVLTLDELHTADPHELGILAAVLQEHVPDNWPLVVVIAALPSLRSTRGRLKLPTYLERAEWHDLGSLPSADAAQALTEPATQAGRPMAPTAAELLLALSGGYPYAIQVAGHFAWRASANCPEITQQHAEAARPRIEADLEQLFRGRWEDASQRERDYLLALATIAEPATGGAVAAQLGEPARELSYLRDRLIKKGTIYANGDNTLHFITPGMGEWLRTRTT
jgi:AAA ATPase domain